jgi:AAHS family benzoate transporter-like MFS transporter
MSKVDVYQIADDAKLNGFHGRVLFWSAFILVIDGYDVQLAGIALPVIVQQMKVTSGWLSGLLVSSAILGMTIGSVLFGTLADRLGRRWALGVCVSMFSVFTAGTALTTEPWSFCAMRFVAGMGLGGVVPSVLAQVTEYAPIRIRSTVVTLTFSGTAIGGMLAAGVGKALLVDHGWQSMFIVAGMPMLLLPMLLKSTPESLSFLLRKGRLDDVRAILRKLAPAYRQQEGEELWLRSPPVKSRSSVRQLFNDGRGLSTAMFWLALFMCLFASGCLSSSLTRVLAMVGYPMSLALTLAVMLNMGALIGTVVGGWLADKFQLRRVVLFMYLIGALAIAFLGARLGGDMPVPALMGMIGLVGATVMGAQLITVAYVGAFYPPSINTTAIGWAGGWGRLGSIVAPFAMGSLLGNWGPQESFMTIGAPVIGALIAVTLINDKVSERSLRLRRNLDKTLETPKVAREARSEV